MDQTKPGMGHWRRVMEARELEDMAEEEERERHQGRWWTDWLCGCREAPRREDQVGPPSLRIPTGLTMIRRLGWTD